MRTQYYYYSTRWSPDWLQTQMSSNANGNGPSGGTVTKSAESESLNQIPTLGILEEDDEFDEFPVEGIPSRHRRDINNHGV